MESVMTILSLLFIGCSGDPDCATQRDQSELRESTRRTSPFELELDGVMKGRDLHLTVKVSLRNEVGTDPVVEVKAPAGSRLEKGKAREALARKAMYGPVVREYVIKDFTGHVDVSVSTATRGAGSSLTKSWPERPAERAVSPKTKRIPRVKVHGVPVDEAIPLKTR